MSTNTTNTATQQPPGAELQQEQKPTRSELLARVSTGTGSSAKTLQHYSGAGAALEWVDLSAEMRDIESKVVAGDLGPIERMLVSQLLVTNGMFNSLAQRAARQDSLKGIEILTRLALKAQSQARATAETLALIKNPMPLVRQTNITTGPQQINNSVDCSRARQNFSEPNELLENGDGERLDTRAAGAPSTAHQELGAVEAVHRTENRRR